MTGSEAREHQFSVLASQEDPFKLAGTIPQAVANFHPEQFVEVDGALQVGDERHGDEAGYAGLGESFSNRFLPPAIALPQSRN
jgi:hypothetical protein